MWKSGVLERRMTLFKTHSHTLTVSSTTLWRVVLHRGGYRVLFVFCCLCFDCFGSASDKTKTLESVARYVDTPTRLVCLGHVVTPFLSTSMQWAMNHKSLIDMIIHSPSVGDSGEEVLAVWYLCRVLVSQRVSPVSCRKTWYMICGVRNPTAV